MEDTARQNAEWRANGCLVLTRDAELGEVVIASTTTASLAAEIAEDHNVAIAAALRARTPQPSEDEKVILSDLKYHISLALPDNVEDSALSAVYDAVDAALASVRLAEQERCAGIAELAEPPAYDFDVMESGWNDASVTIAAAIRKGE